MDIARQKQLLRALEIIAGAQHPSPAGVGDVPGKAYFNMQAFAAIALRSPEDVSRFIKRMENEGWEMPLPYDSEREK